MLPTDYIVENLKTFSTQQLLDALQGTKDVDDWLFHFPTMKQIRTEYESRDDK
jgi:hypothetical protein